MEEAFGYPDEHAVHSGGLGPFSGPACVRSGESVASDSGAGEYAGENGEYAGENGEYAGESGESVGEDDKYLYETGEYMR